MTSSLKPSAFWAWTHKQINSKNSCWLLFFYLNISDRRLTSEHSTGTCCFDLYSPTARTDLTSVHYVDWHGTWGHCCMESVGDGQTIIIKGKVARKAQLCVDLMPSRITNIQKLLEHSKYGKWGSLFPECNDCQDKSELSGIKHALLCWFLKYPDFPWSGLETWPRHVG